MYIDWITAEALFPTCSAQWDVMFKGQETLQLFTSEDGHVLWASNPDMTKRYGFSNIVPTWTEVDDTDRSLEVYRQTIGVHPYWNVNVWHSKSTQYYEYDNGAWHPLYRITTHTGSIPRIGVRIW